MVSRLPVSRLGLGLVIALVLLVGGTSLAIFLRHESARDVSQWQARLDTLANAKSREVNGWLQNHFKELSALADNAALQIYVGQLNEAGEGDTSAQAEYLRNLLTATAQRLDFEAHPQQADRELLMNVRVLGGGGLAIAGKEGKALAVTETMPPLTGKLADYITRAPRGESSLIDLEASEEGMPHLGFILPIYGVQGERGAASQIGSLVGIKPIDGKFFSLVTVDEEAKSLEVALVRKEGDASRYLTPLQDESTLLSRTEPADGASAADHAVEQTGSFAEKTDYRGKQVLMTSRSIPGTPWVLIAKIDREEALAESAAQRNSMAAAFAAMLAALVAIIIGIWRHVAAKEADSRAKESAARARLLAAVTNHQPEPLYIVDETMHLWFTNRRAAQLMGLKPEELRGKQLAGVVGQAYAAALQQSCADAMARDSIETCQLERSEEGQPRNINARFVPLKHIPVEGLADPTPGVLIVEQDITDAVREREARLQTLNQLVSAIVSLIDRRDPHAALRSSRVAAIAGAIASDMGCSASQIETTETAARLMNLGKVDVPAEWLTRKAPLNEEERASIRSSLASTADLLEGIAFEGPVTETLRQTAEHVDGSGPRSLKGDAILLPARIIAAANMLVGLVSARAYRPGMPLDKALEILREGSGRRFDRGVISALMNYLDNQGGRMLLQEKTEARASA